MALDGKKRKNRILHDMDKIQSILALLQKEIDRLFEDTTEKDE